MTQGGQPCKQQNSAQGGPPCAAYLLRRAVCPPNSKMVHRADRPVRHICYAGRSALLTAKWSAGLTALCSTFATQGGPPSYQQNGTQGGPPCASYKLCRAVRPPTSKMVCRADRPVHHISYAGRSALLPAKWCAGRTALCII